MAAKGIEAQRARSARIAIILEQVRQGTKLRVIGQSLGISKQRIHQLAALSPKYEQAKQEGLESLVLNLDPTHAHDSERTLRYVTRFLLLQPNVRKVAPGLFRGPCHACGASNGVYARTALSGGIAECIACGWQGRADVYVLGRRSQALHIVHKPRDRVA